MGARKIPGAFYFPQASPFCASPFYFGIGIRTGTRIQNRTKFAFFSCYGRWLARCVTS
jgi:hypothetical protein